MSKQNAEDIIVIELPDDASELQRIEHQLNNIKRRLLAMPTSEELEAAVQGVKDAFTAGLATIDADVQAAADRVIVSLQNPGVDPTTQIAELNALKDSVSASVQTETDKINAIDPPVVPPAP